MQWNANVADNDRSTTAGEGMNSASGGAEIHRVAEYPALPLGNEKKTSVADFASMLTSRERDSLGEAARKKNHHKFRVAVHAVQATLAFKDATNLLHAGRAEALILDARKRLASEAGVKSASDRRVSFVRVARYPFWPTSFQISNPTESVTIWTSPSAKIPSSRDSNRSEDLIVLSRL